MKNEKKILIFFYELYKRLENKLSVSNIRAYIAFFNEIISGTADGYRITGEDFVAGIDQVVSKLSDEEKDKLKPMIESAVSDDKYTVQLEPLDSKSLPFMLAQPEFMRRMKEMQQSGGGGMFGAGNMPEMFNLVINTNSDLISQIIKTKTKKKQERLISQSLDLAKLSHGLLSGEELTNFIKRSFDIIK